MNHLSKLFKGKTSNTGSINKKHPYGILRHYDNALMHLSDERLTELVEENSKQISEERYKAEAWDLLRESLENYVDTMPFTEGENHVIVDEYKQILRDMQRFYKEVEDND